ncbi:hypothetical protein N798_03780 [Knoellia flava TL1]|nr:hypothetical protein N798_03780 [Knoellia flava TL1]
MLSQSRPMMVSADIDGLVSAAMLGSVAPNYEVVAFSVASAQWLVHPSLASVVPDDLFGVDLFSVQHDNVSNHIVQWGQRKLQVPEVLTALKEWDQLIDQAASERLMAVPSLWAKTQAGYEDATKADSAAYKYPFGTAQILLAMLEVTNNAPKFFDRTYLPWLVANCDGGVSTYAKYANNARIWWPVMAGAVGPGSLTEQVFRLVDTMRPHDFLDAVHRLERERQASGEARRLNDKWNLASVTREGLQNTLRWLTELTGWRDCVRGGLEGLEDWKILPLSGSAQIYYGGSTPSDKAFAANPHWVKVKDDPAKAAQLIGAAETALNANFYVGGQSGSRFNWVGPWETTPLENAGLW